MAKEIRDEYVDTMSKIYYSYFKSYSSRLLKVQVSGVTGGQAGSSLNNEEVESGFPGSSCCRSGPGLGFSLMQTS